LLRTLYLSFFFVNSFICNAHWFTLYCNRASVLEYLVHQVQCLGMFSTHYHRLAVEHKDAKVNDTHFLILFLFKSNHT
jgi:hypothetical protein